MALVNLDLETDTTSAREIREIAYEVGAAQVGEFVLTSGLRSNRYFEGKNITLWPKGAHVVGEAILEVLGDMEIDAIGGLATGAYPIVTAVALTSYQKGRPIPSFVVRAEGKKHGAERRIEGHLEKGWRVAIVDDVITTGGSTLSAIEAVEAMECRVAKVIALVDRHEGGGEEIRRRGYDFCAILGFRSEG